MALGMSAFLAVAPPAGAWIETTSSTALLTLCRVAPPAGAWIETIIEVQKDAADAVAPPAGAWIETHTMTNCTVALMSRLPQARGLKQDIVNEADFDFVAPPAGAWIETRPVKNKSA